MKNGKKTGRWLGFWQKPNKETTSLSNTTENGMLNPKNVTSKEAGREKSSNISLYDTCDTCPLSVYIDVVCDERLDRLIISGHPCQQTLEETKIKLMQEFSTLTGGGETRNFIETTRNFFYQRNRLAGIEIAIRLISSGQYAAATAYLNGSGFKCAVPENGEQADALTKRLQMELRKRADMFRKAKKRYESLQNKGEKPTRKYYNRLLVALSTCEVIKMQLDRNKLTLSEFAEYINILNEYQQHIKSIRNDRKH
jgi:hypothetical protein